jgi:signal transduction histidine kinase
LFVAGLVLLMTVLSFTEGGVRAPGMTGYILIVVLTGVLLGERAAIATALGCAVLSLGLVLIEEFGMLPQQHVQNSAVTYWLLNCLFMGLVIVFVRLTTHSIAEALRRAQTELSERRNVEERLRQSQKMEALGTLAGASHDFNNILGTIQGFAQILAMDLAEGTPQHGFARRVLAACDRGKEVVEQIRLRAGRSP